MLSRPDTGQAGICPAACRGLTAQHGGSAPGRCCGRLHHAVSTSRQPTAAKARAKAPPRAEWCGARWSYPSTREGSKSSSAPTPSVAHSVARALRRVPASCVRPLRWSAAGLNRPTGDTHYISSSLAGSSAHLSRLCPSVCLSLSLARALSFSISLALLLYLSRSPSLSISRQSHSCPSPDPESVSVRAPPAAGVFSPSAHRDIAHAIHCTQLSIPSTFVQTVRP